MAEKIRPEFLDLGGGLNEGDSPQAIRDSEFTLLENFFPLATKIVRRNGTLRITAAPWTFPHTGFFSYYYPGPAGGTNPHAYFLGNARGFSWYALDNIFRDIP